MNHTHNVLLYILLMWLFTYALRVLPLTLIRRPITNRFVRSFLFYTPYVTLSVMTFPAIIHTTQTPVSGAVALAVGAVAAWFGRNLFEVAAACSVVVFVLEFFVH